MTLITNDSRIDRRTSVVPNTVRPPAGYSALRACEDRLRRRLKVRTCLDLWPLIDELVDAAREDERRREHERRLRRDALLDAPREV